MLKSFTIKNFRCFQDFTIEDLERVNLIVGPNNVGKTALLEAIWIQRGPNNPELGFQIDTFRGITTFSQQEPLSDLFFGFDQNETIELKGRGDWGDKFRILRIYLEPKRQIEVPLDQSSVPFDKEIVFNYRDESGEEFISRAFLSVTGLQIKPASMTSRPFWIFLPARYRKSPVEDATYFGKLEIVVGREKEIVDLVKLVEPRLKRLAVIVRDGVSMIHGDIGLERMVPVPFMGDGMGRLLSLGLAIANAPNGVVLVDEFENGLYYASMVKIWKAIAEFARHFDVQLFATTHSEECVRAAHKAFSESERYDFRLHRIDRVKDKLRAVTYDQETLEATLEMGLDFR